MITLDEAIKYWRSQHPQKDQEKFNIRLAKEYDGFNGMLHEEMMDEDKKEFLQAREQIIIYRYEDKLSWIIDKINVEYNSHKYRKPPNSYLPDRIKEHIRTLGYLKYLTEEPRQEILKKKIGKGAAKIIKSIEQSKTAKNPRADNLSKVLTEILQENRDLSWKEVLSKLETLAECNHEVISEVTDKHISWFNNKGMLSESTISGLSKRVSYIKKKIINSL